MKGLKQIRQWISLHTAKAVVFALAFSTLAAVAAWWPARFVPAVVSYACLIVIWTVVFSRDMRALLLILALWFSSVASAQESPPQPAAGVAAGVVVVVVGGVAVYYMVKFCKKAYPPKTNSAPDLTVAMSGDGDNAAASDLYFSDYCSEPVPDLLQSTSGEETLIQGLARGGSIELSVVTQPASRAEFRADMEALGLPLQFGRGYAVNGQTCYPWDSPIQFPQERGEVPSVTILGDDMATRVVERSFDLVEWSPILTNTMPRAMGVRFYDNTTSAAAFYRVR